MKKVLLFIIVVLVMMEGYKHPYFKEWVAKLESSVIDKASKTVGKSSISAITSDFSALDQEISHRELSYLTRNITSITQATEFKKTYCETQSRLNHNVLTNHAFEQACIVLNRHID